MGNADVTRALANHGAPLLAETGASSLTPERALVEALSLSHSEPTLLRALPVFVLRNESTLDWTTVLADVRRRELVLELGLVLDLTATLAPAPHLAALADRLRPLLPPPTQFFFPPRNRWDRELAEAQSPEVAGRWGYVLNMTLEAFRSLLEKHVAPLPAN